LKEIGVSENIIKKAIAISTFKAFTRKFKIHEFVRALSVRFKYINPKKILIFASLFFSLLVKFIHKIKK